MEECNIDEIYKCARTHIIKDSNGISSTFEMTLNPELVVDTRMLSFDEKATKVITLL